MAQQPLISDNFLDHARKHIDTHDKLNYGHLARDLYHLSNFPTDKDVRKTTVKEVIDKLILEIQQGDNEDRKAKVSQYLLKIKQSVVNTFVLNGVQGGVNIATGVQGNVNFAIGNAQVANKVNSKTPPQPTTKKRNREISEEPEDADDSDKESHLKKIRAQLQETIPETSPAQVLPSVQSTRQKLLLYHQQATSASLTYQRNLKIAYTALSEMSRAHQRMEETLEKLSLLIDDPILRQNDDWLTSRDLTPSIE